MRNRVRISNHGDGVTRCWDCDGRALGENASDPETRLPCQSGLVLPGSSRENPSWRHAVGQTYSLADGTRRRVPHSSFSVVDVNRRTLAERQGTRGCPPNQPAPTPVPQPPATTNQAPHHNASRAGRHAVSVHHPLLLAGHCASVSIRSVKTTPANLGKDENKSP